MLLWHCCGHGCVIEASFIGPQACLPACWCVALPVEQPLVCCTTRSSSLSLDGRLRVHAQQQHMGSEQPAAPTPTRLLYALWYRTVLQGCRAPGTSLDSIMGVWVLGVGAAAAGWQ